MNANVIKLDSPFGGESAVFNVIPNSVIPDDSNEILHIIKFISDDFSEVSAILNNFYESKQRLSNYQNIINLCSNFNQWSIEKQKGSLTKNRASHNLIKFLMQFIYNRSVVEPENLNHYEPFSPQVYGETSFDLIDQLLKRVQLKETDTFMDLGSGVGNVVLHVAAVSKCKVCYGFEKAEWPAFYAKKMEIEFKYWMNFFGKEHSEFKLYQADFLSDEEFVNLEVNNDPTATRRITMNEYVKEIINEANLIFVNNYAFGAEVDHQLKLRFCNMLEGSFIVSSKPFCPLNFRINSRNLNDIGTILNVTEFEPLNGHVSWTDKPINYYFHKIDRTLLEKYFERLKNPSKFKEDHADSHDCNSNDSKPKLSPLSFNSNSSNGASSASSASSSSQSSPTSNHHSPSNENSEKSKKRKKSKENSKRKTTSSSSKNQKKIKTEPSVDHSKGHRPTRSLDKDTLKTLDKMHDMNKNVSKEKLTTPIVAKSNSFNNKQMTTLSDENLDNKLLKDVKLSPKYQKQMANGKNNVKENTNGHISASFNDGIDDKIARKILGDSVVDAVDNYLKKCKRQYIGYLLYMKSPEYAEKLNGEIQNEIKTKNELILRKEKLDQQTNDLLKKNVSVLKLKAAELGIKDLKFPHELLQYARDMLSAHDELKNKIKLKTIQQPNQTCQKDSKSSLILNKLLNKIDSSKNAKTLSSSLNKSESLNVSAFKKHVNNKNFDSKSSNGSKNVLTLNESQNNEQLSVSEKNVFNKFKKGLSDNDSSTSLASKANNNSNIDSINNNIRSVESTKSSNETLSATEKCDLDNCVDDEEDMENSEMCYEEVKVEINENLDKKDDTANGSSSTDSNKSNKKTDGTKLSSSSKNKNVHKHTNQISTSTHGKSSNSPNGLSKQLYMTSTLSSSFKIPKQKSNEQNSPPLAHSPALSTSSLPSPTSSVKSNHSSSSSKQTTKHSHHAGGNDLMQQRHAASSTPSSPNFISNRMSTSNSSPSFNSSTNVNVNIQKDKYYYHPKKNQFRQYMMENPNTSETSLRAGSIHPNDMMN